MTPDSVETREQTASSQTLGIGSADSGMIDDETSRDPGMTKPEPCAAAPSGPWGDEPAHERLETMYDTEDSKVPTSSSSGPSYARRAPAVSTSAGLTQRQMGTPALVMPNGQAEPLARVTLTPQGHGDFDEAWLQRLIHDHPACLPSLEIEPGLDPFSSVCMELRTAHGFVDNLLMTGRGDVALVETKLFRNPEARRAVLGQILDYAACVFAMNYVAFENAVLSSSFAGGSTPTSLYQALPEAGKLSEAEFVDAVEHNLRRGRALLLVVGDGIRRDAETLLDGLNKHSRFGFTLAMVEMAVFRMPAGGQFLVQPRTLAKTVITERMVVDITGGSVDVATRVRPVTPETLTSDAYWEALEAKTKGGREALEKLIAAIEPLGIYDEMLASLNLKWDPPDGGKAVNLGYIKKNGSVFFDAACWFAPKPLAVAYVTDAAALFGGDVHWFPKENSCTVYRDGKPIRLAAMMSSLGALVPIMQRFIDAVRSAAASQE